MEVYVHRISLFVFLLFLLGVVSGRLSARETRLLRYPDLFEKTVVFCYAGNIYTARADGREVRRLTDLPGEETRPRFSPDGRQIAFSAECEGSRDVYVMSADGHNLQRLTFHQAREDVVDWSPDGAYVLFRSNAASNSYRYNRLFRIPARGGLPEVLDLPVADMASSNEAGDRLAYCTTSVRDLHFKGYRGGKAPDIWLYDTASKKSRRVTHQDSIDHQPVWVGDHIYFVSDRGADRVQNLWVTDERGTHVRQLTHYAEWEVANPSRGGRNIIFEQAGRLVLLDTVSEHLTPLRIDIPDRQSYETHRAYVLGDNLTGAPRLSPDGGRVAFCARGDLYLKDLKEGGVRSLTASPGANDRYPVWAPDGKRVAYISDATGDDEIHVLNGLDSGKSRQLSHLASGRLGCPAWSPDGRWVSSGQWLSAGCGHG